MNWINRSFWNLNNQKMTTKKRDSRAAVASTKAYDWSIKRRIAYQKMKWRGQTGEWCRWLNVLISRADSYRAPLPWGNRRWSGQTVNCEYCDDKWLVTTVYTIVSPVFIKMATRYYEISGIVRVKMKVFEDFVVLGIMTVDSLDDGLNESPVNHSRPYVVCPLSGKYTMNYRLLPASSQ